MASALPLGYDANGTARDHTGRQQLDQVQLHKLMYAIPGLGNQFSTIPAAAWAEDATDDGQPLAVISCPCGATPEVPAAGLRECECHRFFMYTGYRVMAANRPGQYGDEPVDPAVDPD